VCVCVCVRSHDFIWCVCCEVACVVSVPLSDSCSYLVQRNTSVKAVVLGYYCPVDKPNKWMAMALQVRM